MRIGVVYYYVSDIERSVDFYKNKLGLKFIKLLTDVKYPWAEFEAGGVILALEEVKNKGNSFRPPWGGAVVSFQVENIEKKKGELEKNGVCFTSNLLLFENVKVIQFEDPDGNRLELHERI